MFAIVMTMSVSVATAMLSAMFLIAALLERARSGKRFAAFAVRVGQGAMPAAARAKFSRASIFFHDPIITSLSQNIFESTVARQVGNSCRGADGVWGCTQTYMTKAPRQT